MTEMCVALTITCWALVLLVVVCVCRARHATRAAAQLLAPQGPGALSAATAAIANPELRVAVDSRAADEYHVIEACRVELSPLIDSTPELGALYATLGYAPGLERQATRLLQELTALIEAVIPDFEAFVGAVRDVQAHLHDLGSQWNTAETLRRACLQTARTHPLWQAVLVAGADRARVLTLLNTNPVYAQLPFIEQVPCLRQGEVIWRTPVEVVGLCKRPRDTSRFLALLERLAALFTTPGVVLHAQARQEVLDEIARVQRDLQRPNGYLPTSLQALGRKVTACVQQAPHATARVRRDSLDRFLTACVALRQTYGWETIKGHRLSAASRERFRDAAQQHAQYYLHTAWMHTPWLTTCLLTNVLDSDLTVLPVDVWRRSPSPAHTLVLIRTEIASRHYDSGETIRRLRQQEEQGVYVHSLAYPLLRLHAPAGTRHLPYVVTL